VTGRQGTGPAATIPEQIHQAAEGQGAVSFLAPGREPDRLAWARLLEEARAVAGVLQSRGVGPGDHVALLGPTSRALVTAIEATWLAGAAAVVLPLPLRLASLEHFVAQTRARVGGADAKVVVADPELAALVEPGPGDPPVVGLDELAPGPGRRPRFEEPQISADSLAVLQFTSGSTTDPRGVMLAHRQVLANFQAIMAAAEVGPGDSGVSWLPLYHDMGLIGLLGVPMLSGLDLYLGAPQDFLGSPGRWMEWMSMWRATLTAGPNFAYALAGRAMARQSGLDLSGWRLGINGAEPIDPDAVDAFVAAGAPHRLSASSVFCVYGMAEATLAVSFPEPGAGMQVDWVDRRALEHEACAPPVPPGDRRGKRLAKLGRAVPGLELRVVDAASGRPVGEREVGEIELRGASVTPGYYRNPEASAQAFRHGWLRTGDLGYQVEGQLVVCGRLKDMIIVGGRNVFPEDIERAAASVPGVRAGNVIAFGVEGRAGREKVVVVAEVRQASGAEGIRRQVASAVRQTVGLALEDLVLVEPGSLPKTSSGKLQRSVCRRQYLGRELAEVSGALRT
jgi:fatty-acyl-CoA synthase